MNITNQITLPKHLTFSATLNEIIISDLEIIELNFEYNLNSIVLSDGQHFVFGQKVHEKWMYYDEMNPFNAEKDVDYVEKQPADRFSVTWMIFSWDCFFS